MDVKDEKEVKSELKKIKDQIYRKEYYLITSIAIKRIYKKIKNNSYWHIIRLLFY